MRRAAKAQGVDILRTAWQKHSDGSVCYNRVWVLTDNGFDKFVQLPNIMKRVDKGIEENG